MDNQFARLFSYPTGQLLVTIEFDKDSDGSVIKYKTVIGALSLVSKNQYLSNSDLLEEFSEIDEEKAQEIFDEMQLFLSKGLESEVTNG
jgi:hypothetical protein